MPLFLVRQQRGSVGYWGPVSAGPAPLGSTASTCGSHYQSVVVTTCGYWLHGHDRGLVWQTPGTEGVPPSAWHRPGRPAYPLVHRLLAAHNNTVVVPMSCLPSCCNTQGPQTWSLSLWAAAAVVDMTHITISCRQQHGVTNGIEINKQQIRSPFKNGREHLRTAIAWGSPCSDSCTACCVQDLRRTQKKRR